MCPWFKRFAVAGAISASTFLGCSGDDKNPVAPVQPPHTPVPSPELTSLGLYRGVWVYNTTIKLYDSLTIYAGQPVSLGFDYRYAGHFPDLTILFTRDGAPWCSTRVHASSAEGYAGEGTADVDLSALRDPGTYAVSAVLDPWDRYEEIDETDNADTFIVHVVLGDIAASDVVFGGYGGPNTFGEGDTVRVRAVGGTAGVFHNVRVTLDVDGAVLLDTRRISDGWSVYGSYWEFEADWIAAGPGRHTFTFRVDPDDEVREEDEANNVATAALYVIE